MPRKSVLVTVISALLWLVIGCSTSADPPVPSVPTPNLQAKVETILEEKLAASATPTQSASTSVLPESLGALPTPTSTPTPIPPPPTVPPPAAVPITQTQVAKPVPTVAPIAVAVIPTATPRPTPTPTPMPIVPTPTPTPTPKQLLQAFQGSTSIGIAIESMVHQLSWSLKNDFHEDVIILEAYMKDGNGTVKSSINSEWMEENWGTTTLFSGEQLVITNSFAILYPTINEVQSYTWTWVLKTQIRGDIQCSFTWTIAISCLHVNLFIPLSNPTSTPTPMPTPTPTPSPASSYISFVVDQLPQGYAGWTDGLVTNNHPTKSIEVTLERQIKNTEGYIIKRVNHDTKTNNMCIRPEDTHRFRFGGNTDTSWARSDWSITYTNYQCVEDFAVNIDTSLLIGPRKVQRVITKSYTSGDNEQANFGDNNNIHFTITITNDYSNAIRWAGRLVVMDSQGRVVYRNRVDMSGDNCIDPNEQQTKSVSYNRDKDSFTPSYGTSNWLGINLLEPELVEIHLQECY